VVRAELADGRLVDAHLPNTGRLAHLTVPGNPLILRPEPDPARKTAYTVVRAWDGCWVALEAFRASALLAEWLEAGHPLGVFGPVQTSRSEVAFGRHRLDLRINTKAGATVWVEVKSGGRAVGGTGLLSRTPSVRGEAHLALLGELARSGAAAAAVFVLQRPDVRRLLVGEDADPGWIDAVRTARESGVAVMAYACEVSPTRVSVAQQIPVVWDDSP
jgi:sugar fermentation stimulation protein A